MVCHKIRCNVLHWCDKNYKTDTFSLFKWTNSNMGQRQRWWPQPNTSSQMRKTLTAWMKMSMKLMKTTRRRMITTASQLQSCAQEAPVHSRAELRPCPSLPPLPSTAAPSPRSPAPKSNVYPPADARAQTRHQSLHPNSETSPWMKTP